MNQSNTSKEEKNDELEVEVNLERELVAALDEISNERENNKIMMDQIKNYQENNVLIEDKVIKIEETIISLKIQKEKNCNDQEAENVSLREELEKMSRNTGKKDEEISKIRKENISLKGQLQKF